MWKLSLTGQWHFEQDCTSHHGLSQNCHWSVNDIFSKTAHPTMVSAKTVIDRSMTFLEGCFKIVIDWSMTFLVRLHIPPWSQPKLSLVNDILVMDIRFMAMCHWLWSMTFGHEWALKNCQKKCHWLDVYYTSNQCIYSVFCWIGEHIWQKTVYTS